VSELHVGLTRMGQKISSRDAQRLLASADVDHSGTLDFEEFYRMVEQPAALAGAGRQVRVTAPEWSDEFYPRGFARGHDGGWDARHLEPPNGDRIGGDMPTSPRRSAAGSPFRERGMHAPRSPRDRPPLSTPGRLHHTYAEPERDLAVRAGHAQEVYADTLPRSRQLSAAAADAMRFHAVPDGAVRPVDRSSLPSLRFVVAVDELALPPPDSDVPDEMYAPPPPRASVAGPAVSRAAGTAPSLSSTSSRCPPRCSRRPASCAECDKARRFAVACGTPLCSVFR
jgi:hypothetical protein